MYSDPYNDDYDTLKRTLQPEQLLALPRAPQGRGPEVRPSMLAPLQEALLARAGLPDPTPMCVSLRPRVVECSCAVKV